MTWTESPSRVGCKTFPPERVLNLFLEPMSPTSWTFSLDMGEPSCRSSSSEFSSLFACVHLFFLLFISVFFVVVVFKHSKLLVIPGTDWRKSDPVPADPWVHVVRSGRARANARPGLCARAVSLRPGQLCHNHVEEHHARSEWTTPGKFLWRVLKHIFFFGVFYQISYTTSGNRWQTTSTAHMTTTPSCIMEGELLYFFFFCHWHMLCDYFKRYASLVLQICLLWGRRADNYSQTWSLHSHWPARRPQSSRSPQNKYPLWLW